MTKAILAFGVAAVALSVAGPAEARRTGPVTCAKWHNHHCVAWRSRYNVGYVFGPNYGYTSYNVLPRHYVRQYSLNPRYRYVRQNGYVYVVDPATWAVTRVLNGW